MTVTKVSIKPRRVTLTADGILTDFDFDFKIFAEEDITVYLLDLAEVATLQTLTTDYTVTFDSEAETGTISFLTPPTLDFQVLMISSSDYEQQTDIPKGGGFSEPVVEKAYDLLAIQIQQLRDDLDRAVTLSDTSTIDSVELPPALADAPIGWNSAGDGLTNNPPGGNQVAVDTDATPDFLGAGSGDGVLRVSGLISYVDGGDFVTLTLANTDIDHDQLTNFVAGEHFTMLDEDDMVSDSDTQAATQQSIRAYVLSQIGGNNEFTELLDTPANYAGAALQLVRVNAGETALEFYTLPAAGSITVEDEGTPLTTAVTKFNFAGAGVTVTEPVADQVLVTIPGGGGGGATLTEDVAQAAHGFSVNDWIYHNGTIYALADASDASTAESIGIVSAVADAGNFTVQFGGRITGLSGLTAGEAHFLSETAGAITATAPSTEGAVNKPVLIADSTTSGFIFNMRGAEVTSTTSWYQSFSDGDLSAGVLTVTHNLGHKYCQVQLWNNSDKMIMPDDITLVDADSLTVDLTSYGTLTGTWRVVILDSGTAVADGNGGTSLPFANADLSAGVLTFTHSLGTAYPIIQVYDNNGDIVQPDDITSVDANNTDIDLTSYGTLTGTWNVVAIGQGSVVTTVATDLQLSGQTTGDRLVYDGANWDRKQRVSFRAYLSANQTIANTGLPIQIQINTEEWDYGGYFDTSTYRFTPLVAGIYLVHTKARFTNLTDDRPANVMIGKNGSGNIMAYARIVGSPTATWGAYLHTQCIVEMNGTTDYLETFAINNDTVNRDIRGLSQATYFSAHLLA